MSRNLERRQAFELTKRGITLEVVRILAAGISPDIISQETFFDHSLLHEAVLNDQAGTAAAIIACGADKEYKDKGHRTAFSSAAFRGSWVVSLMLLAAGVKEDERNSEGFRPEALARQQGHQDLADYIRQISLLRFLSQNRKRATLFPQLSLQREPLRRGVTPPAFGGEPGYLGATLTRKAELRQRLDEAVTDARVRPLVETIVMTGVAGFIEQQNGPVGKETLDLMGYHDQALSGPALNGIRLSGRGWDEARPLVQSALDALAIEFESGGSGLSCALGLFKLERVAVELMGQELREFDMTHQPDEAGCRPQFTDETSGLDSTIFNERSFIQRRELVRVDGWAQCPGCGGYIRPEEERTTTEVQQLRPEALKMFSSTLEGEWNQLIDALGEGASADERLFNRNTLAHLGSWCGDGEGWCAHAEALATAMACGADPSATNISGENALHVSAYHGRYFPVLMHLARGVDPEAVDNFGYGAAEMARLNGHENVADLIELISKARKLYDRCRFLEASMPEAESPEVDVKRQA